MFYKKTILWEHVLVISEITLKMFQFILILDVHLMVGLDLEIHITDNTWFFFIKFQAENQEYQIESSYGDNGNMV